MRLALLLAIAACSPAVGIETSAIDEAAPWPMHTIVQGAPYPSLYRGADGTNVRDIDGDGLPDVATAFEEGGSITVSLHPPAGADPRAPWPTTTAATRLTGVEDAFFCDLDGDGQADVIASLDGGQEVALAFAPSIAGGAWTTVPLPSSVSAAKERWMQGACADVDGDGLVDVIDGSRVGTPSTISWWKNPGARAARTGSAWARNVVSTVGYTMSLIALDVDGDGDIDLVDSDRSYRVNADGTRNFALTGSDWFENLGAGAAWAAHHISDAPNLGEQKYLALVDWNGDGLLDVIDGVSSSTKPNRIAIHYGTPAWAGAWTTELVPDVPNVGMYQGLATGDIDGDGRLDLAISYTISNSPDTSSKSGVIWMRNVAPGTWERGEVSGTLGTKYDSVQAVDVDGDGDLDLITSEQIDQLGAVWFENPRTP